MPVKSPIWIILKRANKETDQRIQELKEKGLWQDALDSNRAALKDIDDRAKAEIWTKAKEFGLEIPNL